MDNLPMLRTSERAALKRCPQRWWWAYRMGLRKAGQAAQPLWFGTGIHLALAEWYVPGLVRGREPEETWAEYCKGHFEMVRTSSRYRGDEEDEWTDALELGTAMLKGYRENYGTDENWEVIAPEQRFSLLVPSRKNLARAVAHLVGTFDGVYRDLADGKIYLMEHKSAAQIITSHLPMDPQGTSYIAAATHICRELGLIGPKERIAGIMYNFLGKKKPSPRLRDELGQYRNQPLKQHFIDAIFASGETPMTDKPLEKLTVAKLKDVADHLGLTVYGEVSKVQPEDPFRRELVTRTPREVNNAIGQIADEVRIMNLYRQDKLPLLKNPTKDCSWDCEFFDLCLVDNQGGDTDGLIEMLFNVQNPYQDHLDGAGNSKESVAASRKKD